MCGLRWVLSYLLHEMIPKALRHIVAANNNHRYHGVYAYFEATWLNGQFTPRFWSVYQEAIRTKNSIGG